ncbi:hypothetical protein JCM1840_003469 [Sporobolomyces johnsonii]
MEKSNSDDTESAPSFSSLRARFEQLSGGGASPAPLPSSPNSSPPGTRKRPQPPIKNPELRAHGAGAGGAGQGDSTQMSRVGEGGRSTSTNGSSGSEEWVDAPTAPWEGGGLVQEASRPPARPPAPCRPSSSTVPAPPPFQPTAPPETIVTSPPGNPFQSPPPVPADTRPPLPTSPTSVRKPPPPPRPPSRLQGSSSLSARFAADTAAPPAPVVPSLGSLQPQLPADPQPSPAPSVKSIASRFNDRTPLGSPASSPFSPSPSTTPAVSPTATDDTVDPFDALAERTADPDPEESSSSTSASTYSSSPGEDSFLKPRPALPPRPVLPPHPHTEPQPRIIPPPLPSRSPSLSASSFPTTTAAAVTPPLATSLPTFTRSPSNSISSGSAGPSSSTVSLPLPPPRKTTGPPTPATARPPALPARATLPSVSIPPPPSPTIVPASDPSTPYIPPPPPMRAVNPHERIAPQRPQISIGSGEDGSSDEEEDDNVYAKSQEFPDATFANRRPPVLRNRRPVHSPHQFSSFAVRGTKVVTGHHRLHVFHLAINTGVAEPILVAHDNEKFLSLEFRAPDADHPQDDGRFIWAGTKEGHIYEIDVVERHIVQVRANAHAHPVSSIFRLGRAMVTLDDSGKVHFWGEKDDARAAQLSGTSRQQRVPDKQNFAAMVGDELWTSSGPVTKQGATAVAMRSPQIRVFDPTGARAFSLLPRPLVTPESAGHVGAVTTSAIVPNQDHLVYLGHDNGYVSVWNRSDYTCLVVQRISPYSISALTGVRRYLWAGFRTGAIYVYDVESEPWTVVKAWKAHKDPVIRLTVDPASLWTDEILQVVSATHEQICLWDGFLRDDWIDSELHLRQPDFCTFRSVRALCVSWNIDASRPSDLVGSPDNLEFFKNALTSVDSPDIISFGFQEMIDLEDKKLTAKSMLLGKKKTPDKLSDGLSSAYRQWHDKLVQSVRLAMPPETPYSVVHVGDMIGLFSCIFVKTSEVERLRDISLITVKTGMGGRYGNKGAILSRFVIDDSSLCFINCHLAAGQSHCRQRNRDLVDILEDKASFSELGSSSPGAYTPGGSGTMVFDHELTILSGDLNYRIDARRDVVVSAVASGNCEALLPYDQLLKNLATNQTFRLRSFKEPHISFPPTYKYDPGTDNYDSSAKKRIPAWCDRVLYRADRADKVHPLHYRRYEVDVSDHRPISAAFDLQIKSIVPEKRALVWNEIENAWFGVESAILDEARRYYAGM